MNWDQAQGKWGALAGGGPQTTGLPGRVLAVALLLVVTTMGCSFLEKEQARHRPTQGQVPPPGTASVAGGRPAIVLGTATGAPGQDVTLVVTLQSAGTHVAGTQNDLNFDTANVSLGASGKPSCRVNSAIGKSASAFSLRPNGCQGTACTAVRALVFSVDNTDPIPDGATLYTCTMHISTSAPPGQYRISASGVILSTPAGQKVPNATSSDGVLIVSAVRK